MDPHRGQQETHATGQTHSKQCVNLSDHTSVEETNWPLNFTHFLPYLLGLSHICCNNYTSSFFLLYISTIFFFLTSLPHPCIVWVSFWFVAFFSLSVSAYTSRGPIPASPWGLSLCLVLSPSIDFESKARRVPLTHFSLRCHFACSAVPKLNKMDSGMMWGGGGKEAENMRALMGTVGKIRRELVSPGRQERKTVEQNMKALKSTLSIHIPLRD